MARRRMLKISLLAGFILLFSGTPSAHQEWEKISQEAAESHLLKKVDPVYPSFAKAAGVEGVVRIQVGINTNGRIGSVEIKTGPPCLFKAAEDAILQYVYRPFEINGHVVNADTTVDIVFKLPRRHNVERSYPPPLVADLNFSFMQPSKPATQVSASLQKWVDEELQKKRIYFPCDGSAPADEGEVIPVPAVDPTVQLYLLLPEEQCMCGGSGVCPFELAEVDARGVQTAIDSMGGMIALRQRHGANVPDIFSISHMSWEYADIAGFVKIGGTWGQLYCGKVFGSAPEKSEIHVCR